MTQTEDSSWWRETLETLNAEAGRATSAWLVGLGLLKATRELAATVNDVQIPVPGADELEQRLESAASSAGQRADLVASTCRGESNLTLSESAMQLEGCSRDGGEAEAACRAAAELALGVTSHAVGADEVLRLERAAVVVLAKFSVRATDDVHRLTSAAVKALSVEVAGLVARLVVEGRSTLKYLGSDDAERIDVLVSDDAGVAVFTEGVAVRNWVAPVMVGEIARFVVDGLSKWATPASGIEVRIV